MDLYTIQWLLACCGIFQCHLTSPFLLLTTNPKYWGVFYLRSIMLLAMSHGTKPKIICLINTKGITKTLLKCSFQLQMLTWTLKFLVAYSASSSWSWISKHIAWSQSSCQLMKTIAENQFSWEHLPGSSQQLLPHHFAGAKTQLHTVSLIFTAISQDAYILVS